MIPLSSMRFGTTGKCFPTKKNQWCGSSKLPPKKLEKFIAEWTRLRNAVYVTYPYARVAGHTINDINAKLANVKSKKEQKGIYQIKGKGIEKKFCRSAFQSFRLPGKSIDETDQPANRQ